MLFRSELVWEASADQTAASVATIVGLISICNALGRVLFGGMYDKYGRSLSMQLVNGLFIVTSVVLLLAMSGRSVAVVIAGFVLGGLAYSGCGKTTVLSQFAEKYSSYIYLIRDFDALSPAQLLVEMGECINLPVKLRKSEMNNLKRQLKSLQGVMFLFDEVTAESASSLTKLEMLRKIHDETGIPIVICGVPLLHKTIYESSRFDYYCSLISLSYLEMKRFLETVRLPNVLALNA